LFLLCLHLNYLSLLNKLTYWSIMQKVNYNNKNCINWYFNKLISRSLFNANMLLLFTFPSQYFFTIYYIIIFKFSKWTYYFQTKLHVFHFTLNRITIKSRYGIFTLYYYFSKYILLVYINYFNFFHFRSPLLTKSFLISFPLITEMFHFIRFIYYLIKTSFPLNIYGSQK